MHTLNNILKVRKSTKTLFKIITFTFCISLLCNQAFSSTLTSATQCKNFIAETIDIKNNWIEYSKNPNNNFYDFVEKALNNTANLLENSLCAKSQKCIFGSREHDYFVILTEKKQLMELIMNYKNTPSTLLKNDIDKRLDLVTYITKYICAKNNFIPFTEPWIYKH